jgi:lipoate-protein ligase A
VVSLGCWVKEQFQNTLYFSLINQAVINSLGAVWPNLNGLSQAGISDITMGDKKIAGTSLFRSRNYLLYQASLLVDLDRELVSRVLRHPTKEPDYRHGRSHGEFLTSLMTAEPKISSATQVARELENNFHDVVRNILGDHLIEPMTEQTPALTARLERSQG